MSDPRADNTSATGGFLPFSQAPCHDAALDALQALIAGITGLPADLVRPRWQPEPPREPGPSVNWCAFGITSYEPLNFPEIRHHGAGEGHDEVVDHETLTVLTSFYGPAHVDIARHFRRGVHAPQHRAMLRPAGLVFVRAVGLIPMPALVSMQWRARADLTLIFRLTTRSTFPSLNLLQTEGSVRSDSPGSTTNNDADGLAVPTGCQACARECWRK